MNIDFAKVRDDLRRLRSEDGVVSEAESVRMLAAVLQPLLGAEGYDLAEPHGPEELGIDLIARQQGQTLDAPPSLAIEYKHHGRGRPIGVEAVRQLLGRGLLVPFERLILIGRFGFTRSAFDAARHAEPVSIELLDLQNLEAWLLRLESAKPACGERVHLLIRRLSDEFARLVAQDPTVLDHLEWRDLERMAARVMEGLGFAVTLTPPSKDGGKDLVLSCQTSKGDESFIVELKHWRAGKRVGKQAVSDFFQVIVFEKHSGGLFLSSSGYTSDAFEGLTEITRQRLRLGDRAKLVLLAQTYVRAVSGLWSPPAELPQVLFEGTL